MVAVDPWMYHWAVLRSACRLRASVTSATLIAFGRSCLFANTSNGAALSSSSASMRDSSSLASPILSRSFESTTKITADVF